jgi:hypothetical protein
MADLILNAIELEWSSAASDRRGLYIQGSADRPALINLPPTFELACPISDHEADILALGAYDGTSDGTPEEVLDELSAFAARRAERVEAILAVFFEVTLRRAQLPQVPLRVSDLLFGQWSTWYHQDEAPRLALPWLSPTVMPMKARLANKPGAPFGGLHLSYDEAGNLASVRAGSHRLGRRSPGNPDDRLFAPSAHDMDVEHARRFFELRYGPEVTVDIMTGLEWLGQVGRTLGVELLAALT